MKISVFLRGVLMCAAVFILAACGGLGGEPRIISTDIPTPLPQDTGYPMNPPDLALGAQVFAENCTSCHGAGARGDGELVAAGRVPSPGDFTNPAAIGEDTPAQWFDTITNGRLENLMPPWRGVLTEEQRWAVAYYVYMLHYPAEASQTGAEFVSETIPQAVTDPQQMIALNDAALLALDPQTVTLDPAQQFAAAGYLRALGLQNTQALAQIPEPAGTEEVEVAAAATIGAVTGTIANETAGGTLPETQEITLYVVQQGAQGVESEQFTTTADAEGRFTLEGVPLDPARTYIATTLYRDRIFASDFIPGAELLENPSIALPIYELTEDPTVIQLQSVRIWVDAVGEGLQILQELSYTNTSDRMYTNSLELSPNRYASVVAGLPPGAFGLAFPGDPNRYVHGEEQSVVVDSQPVVPGEEHVVQFSYLLPYEDSAIIEQPVYYNLEGPVTVYVYPPHINASSEQLTAGAPENFFSRDYQAYSAVLSLSPGEVIRYDLQGSLAATAEGTEVVTSNNLPVLLIIGLVIEIAIVGGLLYLYLRRRQKPQAKPGRQLLIDGLVRQIAELDDQHAAGQIDETTYQNQRTQLKTRLAELMEQS